MPDPSDETDATPGADEALPESDPSPADQSPIEVPAEMPPEEETAEGQILQPCPNCAALLDVTDEEPFAHVHCPICGTHLRARTQLKNFALTETLGSGGMGSVYKARDLNLNRLVALKVVRKEYSADAEYLGKFEREARITASVNHPHIVKVFSFGSDHGLFYIAMELVDKGSLDDLMALQGRVAEAQMLEVGIQAAQGLHAAHKVGLIHRDVKPGNILFADARTAKIVDFGLALLAEHEAEERGEVWGTPYYVAPEKLNHEPEDYRSDIYSLGGTLFHAVSGRPPFEAENASLVALKHLKSKAVSLQAFAPDVSSATAFVINRMLDKDPSRRYQTYEELIEHLTYARTQLLEAANKPRQPKQRVVVETQRQQSVMGWLTLALLVLVIGVGAALWIFREQVFHLNAGGTAADASSEASKNESDKYQVTRQQMIDGDFQGAQDAFQKLGQEPALPQPLQNWITVHEGLSALLVGHLDDAREAFKMLNGRAPFSRKPEDQLLVGFFTKIGRLGSSGDPVPASAQTNFATNNCEALAHLIFGLKDWEMGSLEDGHAFLQSFASSEPADPFVWIGDYRPLTQKYGEDFKLYEEAVAQAKAAEAPEKRGAALEQLRQLRGKARGRVAEKIRGMQQQLEKQVAERDAAEAQRRAEVRSQEEKVLQEAQAKIGALCTGYKFDEALALAKTINVTDAAVTAQRDTVVKKMEALLKFKAALIADVNAVGYPSPVATKSGAPTAGGFRQATAADLRVQTPYGFIPVLWTELPPASLLTVARFFIANAKQPQAMADRQWFAGIFATQLGLKEGHDLLVQAAQGKPEYREQLTNLDGGTAAP